LDSKKNVKIAIMGAGLSGLACALMLERNGIRPEIFESKGEVGDRFINGEAFELLCLPIWNFIDLKASSKSGIGQKWYELPVLDPKRGRNRSKMVRAPRSRTKMREDRSENGTSSLISTQKEEGPGQKWYGLLDLEPK
jgi:hypothetical protein